MLTIQTPFSFLLFGASGNLAKLKIYPALYTLALKKRLPAEYTIVGFARTHMSEQEFRSLVSEAIKIDMIEVNAKVLEEFLSHVHYVSGQYDRLEDFQALGTELEKLEKGWSGHVRLAYLSIPPTVIEPIISNLCAAKVDSHDGTFRCIVEKPVGQDLKSFEDITSKIAKFLPPEETYFLDHYLGKEAVRNIYYLRLANPILEHLCNASLVQHVEITAMETLGIQGRAGYFEHTGMFRDFVQSHLLMMASLLTMPLADSDDTIMQRRYEALKMIALPDSKDMSEIALQAQYSAGMQGKTPVLGYLDEEGVKPQSRTNTFVALKLQSADAKWKGVPLYLRAGKRLSKKETRVSLQFFEPRSKEMGKNTSPNRLDMILQGEAGMRMHLQTKVGGTEPMFRPLLLEDPLVCVGDCLPEHSLLLLEAIHGRKTWFVSPEEVRAAWKLVDPVQTYLEQESTPLHTYPAGSDGPEQAKKWIAQDGVQWF